MKYLYLDNFRGFQKANIPLCDVNFLVGENSTGKTSVLNVLKMFSTPRFLIVDATENDDPVFGHFNEMVSAHSQDKTYFRLGIASHATRKENLISTHCWMVTYKNVNGLAEISRLTCDMYDKTVSLLFDGGKVFSKIAGVSGLKNDEELKGRLSDWAAEHGTARDNSWRQLPEPSYQMPIFFLLSVAAAQSEKLDMNNLSFQMPAAAPPLIWIAPIRSKPRRTYDEPQTPYSPEGAHTPYVIKRMLSSSQEAKRFKRFMEEVGSASGLFQKILVKRFGKSDISPFEVDAYLDNKALGIASMGYGVSQSLPIFVELLDRASGSWFAIQQPEVHLHPRAQAALGDVFFEMAAREHKRFLIETHSDFTLDRFRMNYRRRSKDPKKNASLPESQILFFERREKHNVVTALPISRKGALPTDQPDSYRSFFMREQMNLLGMK